MQFKISKFSLWLSLMSILASILVAFSVRADVRADYLISLLKNGSSYRVKIQAAQSLGRIQCRDAIPALEEALSDESAHVIIAAAAALGEIGDPASIPALKAANRKGHSTAVRNQIASTISLLQERLPDSQTENVGIGSAEKSFLVKVDAMGNSSTTSTVGITEILRNIVVEALVKKQGVEIQAASTTDVDIRQQVKNRKIRAFILSGALIKLNQEEQFMVAKVALNVLSNPDYNLVMMPSGEARIPIDFSSVQAARQQGASQQTIQKLERQALQNAEKQVLKKLVENLIGKILEAAPDVL